MKKSILFVLCLLLLFTFSGGVFGAEQGPVYIVKLDDTIDYAAEDLLARAIQEANLAMSPLLIVEIDTYGGYIDSAINMKDIILSSPVKTVTFVNKKALSAGALIAFSGETLFISQGSTIGAAEAREGDEKADEKVTSAWVSELSATASARDKDPNIAAAMADSTIAIEGVIEEGRLLTLTDVEALDLGMADYAAESYEDIYTVLEITPTTMVEVEQTFVEKFSVFVTNPVVAGILIAIGLATIIIEILTSGFSGLGVIGISAFALYFAGHIILTSVGWVALLLFFLGIILIIVEAFVVPGFGITGIAGIAGILGSIFLVAPTPEYAILSLLIAIVLTTIVLVISLKHMKTRKIWKKLILNQRTDTESGYTVPNVDNKDLLGKEGVTITPLRPAGAIELDGERIDVVTEGDFLAAGISVRIVGMDGTRIIVRVIK